VGTTPLARRDVLCGKGLAILIVETAQLVLLGLVGIALGWQPEPLGVLMSIPLVVLGSAALAALALLLAGVVRAEATLALANLAYLLLAGAGVVVPIGEFPSSVQPFLELLPSAALAEALRVATMTAELQIEPLAVLIVWCAMASLGVARYFKWE
jgi:ABC-2 type transport system permease protein